MKKNNAENKYSHLTYNQNRKCKWCFTPIADQEHLKREFCDKTYDENNKVKDCKTAYHRSKDQPIRELPSNIINNHKDYTIQFEQMIAKKGLEVYTQDIEAYDISLANSISFVLERNGILISKFIHHTVVSNPNNHTHKITKNE